MMTNRFMLGVTVLAASFMLSLRAGGQSFDLFWHTVDGGGGMNSTGGAFTLSGNIGQPDAQTPPIMAGGSFELTGGYWPAAALVCTCPGDLNGDALRNGLDIHQFVQCVISGGSCGCADVDGLPGVNMGDVAAFVSDVLAGASCP
jgi:hypothetical protein